MKLILWRTMNIFFMCVISAPLFMDTMYYSRYEMIEECFQTFYQTLHNQNFSENDLKILTENFINVTLSFNESPLIYFESPYKNYSAENMNNFRESDRYEFHSDHIVINESHHFSMTAVFSGRHHNSMQSTLGLAAYLWYFIMMLVIVFWIKRHIEKQVVIPFNSLFEKIWLIIIDPMIVVMSSNNKLERMAGIYSMAKQFKNNRDGAAKND